MKLDRSQLLSRNAAVLAHPPTMTPTNHFPDGPLLGNGDMTVVNAGVGNLQTFHIGKSDFWTDGVGYEMTNEEYDNYVVSPITVGSFRLWVRDFAIPTYHQRVDLERAELCGTFTGQDVDLRTRSWVCATTNVLFVEIHLRDTPGPVGFHLRVEAKSNDDPLVASLPTSAGTEEDAIQWATRETWDRGRWVARACIAMKVIDGPAASRAWTGAERHANAAVLLKRGERCTVAIALAGGKDATAHREDAIAILRSLTPQRVAQLRVEHESWWRGYWDRSLIDLGGDVVERFWYGSQYALACCSRPGKVCPGLFGFSTHDHPRWSGDYHLNYNGEHPFAGTFSSNRFEQAEPFFDAMNDFIEEGKRRAARDLKPPMPGVYLPIGLGPWGVVAQDNYMSQKCAAAYAAWPFIEHFRHTRDVDFARAKLYPSCKLAGEFWLAYLQRDEQGTYHIKGSASHEHGGHDHNANFDLPLVKNLFKGLIEMSEALEVDADLRERYRDVVEHLAPYPTIDVGGKRLFKEADNCDHFTRSISLYNVMWPGAGDVGLWGDAKLCQTGRDTLIAIDKWEQGNSFSWIYPAAVRVGLPGIYERLRQRLEAPHNGLRANGTYAQAHGGIETFGATAAVNEMLLQSYDGVIRVFPVWPRERDAAFTSLRAVGAHLVSASLADGEVRSVSIVSEKGEMMRVEVPWNGSAVVRSADGEVARGSGVLSFNTTAGLCYSVERLA